MGLNEPVQDLDPNLQKGGLSRTRPDMQTRQDFPRIIIQSMKLQETTRLRLPPLQALKGDMQHSGHREEACECAQLFEHMAKEPTHRDIPGMCSAWCRVQGLVPKGYASGALQEILLSMHSTRRVAGRQADFTSETCTRLHHVRELLTREADITASGGWEERGADLARGDMQGEDAMGTRGGQVHGRLADGSVGVSQEQLHTCTR